MRRPEQEMQKAIVAHLRQRGAPGLVWFHVPNGGKRRRTEAAIMKSLGVRAGVSDLILIHRGDVYAIELKAGDNSRPTVEQMEFISDLNAAGGHGVICDGLDRALRCLECWGLITGSTQFGSDHPLAVLDAGAADVTCAPGGPNTAQIPVRKVRGMNRRRAA